MNTKIIIRALLTWILFIPIAILNGILRNDVYQQYTGELLGHQISTITGSIAFVALVYLMMGKLVKDLEGKHLIWIGLVWIAMTICFEFPFGHYVIGHSWQKLFHDYNILEGRIWILFLLVCACSPLIVKKMVEKKS